MKSSNAKVRLEIMKAALQKYNSYGEEWEKAYFDKDSGGYNVYHNEHKFSKKGGGGNAEKTVGLMLAKYNGKQVEFLPEREKAAPDIKFDEQTWDIKYIDKANEETIRSSIKDARKAENAIFYWDTKNKLDELKNSVIRSIGYFKSQNALKTMPNIYYMENKSGLLKLLWEKTKRAK